MSPAGSEYTIAIPFGPRGYAAEAVESHIWFRSGYESPGGWALIDVGSMPGNDSDVWRTSHVMVGFHVTVGFVCTERKTDCTRVILHEEMA